MFNWTAPSSAFPHPSNETPKLTIAVADANWHTTSHLFNALDRPDVSVFQLKCWDYRNALNMGRPLRQWVNTTQQTGPHHWTRDFILPPGWMKRYPSIGMRPIAQSVRRWRQLLGNPPLVLVLTYPHYRYLRDQVRPSYHVYLNLDDYQLYWPHDAEAVAQVERSLVREADLTVCVAHARAEHLRESVPNASKRIVHLPHGTPEIFLEPGSNPSVEMLRDDLAPVDRPIFGYVGGLEDRVDWELLDRVATRFSQCNLVLVGRTPNDGQSAWSLQAQQVLQRPNVRAIGARPQNDLPGLIQQFDVCLIPYDLEHPFNRSSSPTKIMDYMGSGRPIVASALPECRLYETLMHVAEDHQQFLKALEQLGEQGFDDQRSEARRAWARDHSCAKVADRLLGWIDRVASGSIQEGLGVLSP